MNKLLEWFLSLVNLLSSILGDDEIEVDDDDQDDDDLDDGEDGADAGSGKTGGKKRSQSVPRERFDQVNAKAQKAAKLIELGILSEDEDGELHVNPDVLKPKENPESTKKDNNFRFTKDEVDEASWPLVEKINKGFDFYEQELQGNKKELQEGRFLIAQLMSENAIIRDYPEFIQRDSELKKKALDIMKNDSEFKKTYKGKPDRGYWAVKRAAEFLANKTPAKKPVKKSRFIVGKGDPGQAGKKMVSISELSKTDLDRMEREEHDRLQALKSKPIR